MYTAVEAKKVKDELLNLALPNSKNAIFLNREDQDILSYISKFGSISISEAEKILPEVNRRSLQRRLKNLVDTGYLTLLGETHEAKYVLKEK